MLSLLALMLCACGGSTQSDPCQGLPTAKRSAPPLVLFGAIRKLDQRALCARFGRPNGVRRLSGGREIWAYHDSWFTVRRGRVIRYEHPQPSY